MVKNTVFNIISKGNATLEYSKSITSSEWLDGVLDTFSHSILPFMIASRFKFKSIEDVYNSKEVFHLRGSSKSAVELLELFLTERCKRVGNTAFDGRDYHFMFKHDRFRPYLNEKMREFKERETSGNLTWTDETVFEKLALLTTSYDRKKLGSISTPYELVCEIEDSINFKPGMTILDPSCGRGPFLYRAKEILINSGTLECDAIMSLRGMDKDERLCYLAQAILDPKGLCEPIITHADSLNYDWRDMKFDVIVGNPPYQSPKKGDASLWPLFIQSGFNILNDHGFMGFILPSNFIADGPNIRKGKINCWNSYLKNNIIYANIGDFSKYFPGVGHGIEYIGGFVIEKQKSNQFTNIITTSDSFEYDVSNMTYLPNRGTRICFDIIKKVQNFVKNSNNYNFQRGISGSSKEEKHSCRKIIFRKMQHNMNVDNTIFWDLNGGIDFDHPNEIFDKGILCSWMKIPEKATEESLTSIFKSKLYSFLFWALRQNGTVNLTFQNNLPMFDLEKIWTDQELYEELNLSSEEIEYLENNCEK